MQAVAGKDEDDLISGYAERYFGIAKFNDRKHYGEKLKSQLSKHGQDKRREKTNNKRKKIDEPEELQPSKRQNRGSHTGPTPGEMKNNPVIEERNTASQTTPEQEPENETEEQQSQESEAGEQDQSQTITDQEKSEKTVEFIYTYIQGLHESLNAFNEWIKDGET